LTSLLVGGSEALAKTIVDRQTPLWSWSRHLITVPPLMFTWIVLGVMAIWIATACFTAIRRRLAVRELIPLTFGVGGIIHYAVFKWSAQVHEYWGWTALPGVAIVMAIAVRWVTAPRHATAGVSIGSGALGWSSALRVAAGLALIAPLAVRCLALVPEGRRVGGSLWFLGPVRGAAAETYSSSRRELRFAEIVRRATTRDTGVLLDEGLLRRRLEVRFDATLDRTIVPVQGPPGVVSATRPGITGWVYLAAVEDIAEAARRALATDHPYRQIGDLFFVDFRRAGSDIRVEKWVPCSPRRLQRYVTSSLEPPEDPEPDPGSQRAFEQLAAHPPAEL
jgi:hypothetical protein